MPSFYYRYIKVHYSDKVKMVIPVTDSFCYLIDTENLYEGFYKDK